VFTLQVLVVVKREGGYSSVLLAEGSALNIEEVLQPKKLRKLPF